MQEGEGFLVGDDEEDEVEEEVTARKRRKKKRAREADEALDEEDLDLIGFDVEPREQRKVRYKHPMSLGCADNDQ